MAGRGWDTRTVPEPAAAHLTKCETMRELCTVGGVRVLGFIKVACSILHIQRSCSTQGRAGQAGAAVPHNIVAPWQVYSACPQ